MERLLDHFQLTKFEVQARGDQALILVKGNRNYYDSLRRACPDHSFSRAFEDIYHIYDWATYVRDVDDHIRIRTKELLQLFNNTVYLDDVLTESFALDYHHRPFEGGKTQIGELVYRAKYKGDQKCASQLADRMENFISKFPLYLRSSCIVAVPPSTRKRSFDLPLYLAAELSRRMNIS